MSNIHRSQALKGFMDEIEYPELYSERNGKIAGLLQLFFKCKTLLVAELVYFFINTLSEWLSDADLTSVLSASGPQVILVAFCKQKYSNAYFHQWHMHSHKSWFKHWMYLSNDRLRRIAWTHFWIEAFLLLCNYIYDHSCFWGNNQIYLL